MEREFLFTYKLGLIVLGLGCHTRALLQIHQAWQVHYTATFFFFFNKFWHLIYSLISLSTKNTFIRVHRAAAVETQSLAAFIWEITINTICFQLSICFELILFFLKTWYPAKSTLSSNIYFQLRILERFRGLPLVNDMIYPKRQRAVLLQRKLNSSVNKHHAGKHDRWNMRKCRFF